MNELLKQSIHINAVLGIVLNLVHIHLWLDEKNEFAKYKFYPNSGRHVHKSAPRNYGLEI